MPTLIDAQFALVAVRKTRGETLPAIRRALDDQLTTAQTYTDPDLTPQAVADRRTTMAKKARAEAEQAVAKVAADTAVQIATVREFAASQQLTEPADPNAALLAEMRQGRAWDRARQLLDSGRSVADVVDGADADTLRALARELPAYLAAQTPKPSGMAAHAFTEADPAPQLRKVERALVDRLPGEQSAALRMRLDVDAVEPGLNVFLDGLRAEAAGRGTGLENAVAVRLADQAAGVTA